MSPERNVLLTALRSSATRLRDPGLDMKSRCAAGLRLLHDVSQAKTVPELSVFSKTAALLEQQYAAHFAGEEASIVRRVMAFWDAPEAVFNQIGWRF